MTDEILLRIGHGIKTHDTAKRQAVGLDMKQRGRYDDNVDDEEDPVIAVPKSETYLY